jgi:hypothetical protein
VDHQAGVALDDQGDGFSFCADDLNNRYHISVL